MVIDTGYKLKDEQQIKDILRRNRSIIHYSKYFIMRDTQRPENWPPKYWLYLHDVSYVGGKTDDVVSYSIPDQYIDFSSFQNEAVW